MLASQPASTRPGKDGGQSFHEAGKRQGTELPRGDRGQRGGGRKNDTVDRVNQSVLASMQVVRRLLGAL